MNGIEIWLVRGIVQKFKGTAWTSIPGALDIFAFCSPILGLVFHAPTSGLHPFVIVCKGCQQNIPAPIETMPDSWIIAECPLCRQPRRYLPTDIFQGRLSHELVTKTRQTGGERWAK